MSGHQLHFDSDNEGIGGIRNPIVSSVVYLSAASGENEETTLSEGRATCAAAIGGPTLVTDQCMGGPLATQGWLAYPAVNRVTLFDGRVLHGAQAPTQCP